MESLSISKCLSILHAGQSPFIFD